MWYFSAIDFHKKHFLGYLIRPFLISCLFGDFLHGWEDFAWFVVPTNFSKIHKVDVLAIRVIFIAIPFSPTVRGVTRGQFPVRPITGRHRKLPKMFQVLSSIQYYSQKTPKRLGSNQGAPNLLLAPGAIQPRYTHPKVHIGISAYQMAEVGWISIEIH